MRITRMTTIAGLLACSSIAAYAMPMLFHRATSMNVSPDIPAAKATVKFDKSDNGNINFDLKVKFLAEPGRLQPPAATYVVWVRADHDSPAQNIGALKVDATRKGSLKSGTPLRTFDLFVTGENTGAVQEPTGQRLIWTHYSAD